MSKLNDAESEAAETQTRIDFSIKCDYLDNGMGKEIYSAYDQIIGKLVNMINNPTPWLLGGKDAL